MLMDSAAAIDCGAVSATGIAALIAVLLRASWPAFLAAPTAAACIAWALSWCSSSTPRSVVISADDTPQSMSMRSSCGLGEACCFSTLDPSNWIAVAAVPIEFAQLCSITAVAHSSTSIVALLSGAVAAESPIVEGISLSFALLCVAVLLCCRRGGGCCRLHRRAASILAASASMLVLPVCCRVLRAALDARRRACEEGDGSAAALALAVVTASAWSVTASAAVRTAAAAASRRCTTEKSTRSMLTIAYTQRFLFLEFGVKMVLATAATVWHSELKGVSGEWALLLLGAVCCAALLLMLLCLRPCSVPAVAEVRSLALLASVWCFFVALCGACSSALSSKALVLLIFGGWLAIVLGPGLAWVWCHARQISATAAARAATGTEVGAEEGACYEKLEEDIIKM